jgi:predicted metalloprotease with PDZ domain
MGPDLLGGAMFCLLADIEIRKKTGNAQGLRDALRAINRAGGTIEADWPLERVIEVGDKATNGKVFVELYTQMASKPVSVDLLDLWEQIGRSPRRSRRHLRQPGGARFDPREHLRNSLMRMRVHRLREGKSYDSLSAPSARRGGSLRTL